MAPMKAMKAMTVMQTMKARSGAMTATGVGQRSGNRFWVEVQGCE